LQFEALLKQPGHSAWLIPDHILLDFKYDAVFLTAVHSAAFMTVGCGEAADICSRALLLVLLLLLLLLLLLERPLDVRPLDSFPSFHGARRFSTEFTTALHLFLS
jgi:hypothetical protein